MDVVGVRPTFRQRLELGEQLVGMIITLSDPVVTEIMAQAGFDWLWFDGEHSPLDVAQIQTLAQVAGSTHSLVRVPGIDQAWVKKSLEAGVDGIIFPLINDQQQAERAVRMSKYPPLGNRSVGVGRAQRYGPGFHAYLQSANERICTIVQIEHIAAVKNVQSILAVAGVDALMIGPYDLSSSMGSPGSVDAPEVKAAMDTVLQAGHSAGKPVGVLSGNALRARQALHAGYNFVGVSVDAILLAEWAGGVMNELKE